MWRLWVMWLAVCVLLAVSGCTFLQYRGADAADMLDFGVSLTRTPQFAAYKACTPIFAIGYGDVDGLFFGLGGGRFGLMPHYHKAIGLALWGEQKVAFGDFDKEDPATLNWQRSGPLGSQNAPPPGPEYMLCCVQHLHLGWGGLVLNARWLQMADFLAGWFGVDFCNDDGRERGSWTAPAEPGATPVKACE